MASFLSSVTKQLTQAASGATPQVVLAPVPQQVGIFDQFIAKQSETIVLKEKVLSLTGDSFDIKLANGQPILKVQGKLMSISGRKSVYDMAGNHLFDLVKEHLHIHTTFAAVDPNGVKLLEVKSSFTLFGSNASGTFTNPRTGVPQTLRMKGNWLDSVQIVDESTGAVVAHIAKKILDARNLLFGQQTYNVVIAPGVDLALMAAMCICLDEKRNDK